ncbi:hypothetical protein [Leucobacter denitrificans]|uniref:Uncharacterized protein n=1 Tax=Leucobacter denitrificans TaxID=683042 RepID=A0A7G9S6U2_9MICO|nr:hypothetical protein [Leucobacter denitrificans]QNN63567.1 hypothetical protein H9L06_04440 [Leucobacter denitrificans]
MKDQSTLERASSIWRENGELRSNAAIDENTIPINYLPHTDALLVVLDSEVIPMEVNFRTFSALTDTGIPVSNIPDFEIKCTANPDAVCHMTPLTDSVIISISASILSEGMNVLEAYYATQEKIDVKEGVNHYAVS